jgi:hypothetical protein
MNKGELATQVGVDPKTITNIERRRTPEGTDDVTLARLAAVFELSEEALLTAWQEEGFPENFVEKPEGGEPTKDFDHVLVGQALKESRGKVMDVIRRVALSYGKTNKLSTLAVRALEAVDELRSQLEEKYAAEVGDNWNGRVYRGPSEDEYDRAGRRRHGSGLRKAAKKE